MSTTDEEVGEHVVTEDDVNNIIKETEKEMEVVDKTIQEGNIEETTKSDVQTEQVVSEENTVIKSEQDTSDYNNPEQVVPEQDVTLLIDDNIKQEQGIPEEEPNIQTTENIPEVDTSTQPVQDVTENVVPDKITDGGFPEKSEDETVPGSAAIIDQVIQIMIKEFVVKSLENIVETEEIDVTFIHNIISEIILSIDFDKVEIERRISRASTTDKSDKKPDEITKVEEIEKLPDIVEEVEITKDVIKEIVDQIIVNEVLENIPYDEIDRKKLKQTMKDLIVLDIIQTFKSEEKIVGGKRTVATGMGTDEDFKEIKSGVEETSEEIGEYHPTVTESREQVSEIEPEVLDPNSPLMKRFQIALKNHLFKQKNRFEEEILTLNGEMREQSKVEEDLSEQIYTLELKINQQNNSLDQLLQKIQEYCSSGDHSTNLIGEQKTIYKEKCSNLDEVKRKDTELRIEVESLAALIKQFSEWEANQTSDITTTKLMSERHKVEKIKLFKEKQSLDVLLLAIRKDVLKLSTHNNDTIKLIQIKMKERADIEQGIVDANIDIEALISNNNRIMRLWRGNIVLISQRDKILLNMRENFEEHRKQFATLESQVEGITKETDELIKQNEKLTAKLQYIERLFNANKKQLQEELEKRRTLRSKLHELTQMRDATEETLTGVTQELQFVQKNQIKSIDKFERLRLYRAELEEAIIKKIAEQTIETKTSRALNNKIVKQRIQLREKEVILSDLENAIAKVMVKIEKQKMIYDCGGIELEEIKEELRKKEVCVKKYQKELERTTTNGQLAQVQVDKQICRLAKLKEEVEESELTPEEIRIRELEKNISEMDEKTEHIKNFWMRQENHIVSISQQRSHQLQQISVLRKQLVILDKKNLKIEFDIQEQEKEEKKYNSIRSTIQKRLVKLNEQCYKTKGYKDVLDNNNLIIQNQYISDLKDAEDEYHKMQKEINDSETEKGELYNKITELQKEVLGWEKKLQLAVETRQLLMKLNADGGELANMKSEIHKMEIRYSQLRKAQENLAHDLELCISRRDGIVDFNRAREKQSNKGVHYNRQQFLKKIEDFKNGIRKTQTEMKNIEKECVASENRKKELSQQLKTKNEQLAGLNTATQQMDQQLAEGHLHRQKNLEVLVRLQRKSRLYNELKNSRYKLLFRNESTLDSESQKQKSTNSNLMSVLEALIQDFPSLQMPFTGVLNSLRVSTTY